MMESIAKIQDRAQFQEIVNLDISVEKALLHQNLMQLFQMNMGHVQLDIIALMEHIQTWLLAQQEHCKQSIMLITLHMI